MAGLKRPLQKQALRPVKRIAQRAAENVFEPPALSVEPALAVLPAEGTAAAGATEYSIATTEVIPGLRSVAPKIQRKESDDGSPALAPTPAPPDGSGSNAEQLTAGSTGTTNILAPTVSSKTYSGKTLQDVANAMPPEPGSLTFDIATKADGDPITKATVTVKQVMVLARWAERDKQCKPIQAAWDRFASALRVHEDEHVKINKQQLANAHDRYVGRPQSETQDVTTELENETFAAGQAFDGQTDHGKTATPSTTIDVGVKCDDKNTSIDVGSAEDEAVQAKLEVSQPGDPDEEEADRVADQVMRMAEPGESPAIDVFSGAKVVKRCAACEAEEEKLKATAPPEGGVRVRRKCAECEAEEKGEGGEGEEKKEGGQRKSTNGRSTVDESSRVTAVARSGGQPLDAGTRAFMEPRFGFDFSHVRVHADSHAAEAARTVNARAFTLGSSVVFGAGRYAPGTSEGRQLLAHELTHVVQQGSGGHITKFGAAAVAAPAIGSAGVVQRKNEPNASLPPPNKSEMPAPKKENPDEAHFEGHALRFDAEVLYKVLSDMAAKKGVDAPHEFVGRFRTLAPGPLALEVLPTNARPGLYQDLIKGLDDALARLKHEQEEYTKTFEQQANQVAQELLAKSEQTIKAEVERLGITGDVLRGPGGGVPDFKLSNTSAASTMRDAARALVPFAKTYDDLGRQSAAALNRLNEASRDDPFGLMTKPQQDAWQESQKKFLEAAEAYEKERRAKVAENPSLAMYADQPGAAAKLNELASTKDEDLANNIGTQARDKLSKIAMVKDEIGKRFSVWGQPHLRRVTLDSMGATPLQREVIDRKVKAKERAEADDKLLFSVLAIGLGLLAAIPTGGSSLLLTGVAVAAGAAGAALSLYQMGEEGKQNSLAQAANATDFDKAKAISQNEPESMQLAITIVGALADVFAAATAFKALNTAFKAAKAGDVKAALNVANVAERVGISGSAKNKIVAEAVAGLKDEAIEATAKTMARSGGMSRGEYIAKMQAGLAEHSQFKKELDEAAKLLEHVQGRIPDHARELVKNGRVRVFSEASFIEVFGATEGPAKWKRLQYADGLFSQSHDIVFIRSGQSSEDIAGTLIHEATHRVGASNPARGNNFMSEAIAEFAERDFYITLYHADGPLAGRQVTSPRIKEFLTMDDAELLGDIERRYYDAKKDANFIQKATDTPEKVVEQIFQDIAADYKAKLPKE